MKVFLLYFFPHRLKHFINISWHDPIPVLKNGIRNKVFQLKAKSQLIFQKRDEFIQNLGDKFRQTQKQLCQDF